MLRVLGHQGGWDEIAMFAVPVIALLAWIRWAEKRARRRAEEASSSTATMPPDSDT